MHDALHAWMNIATLLVIVGGCCYLSLIPYMTSDD
jgi:hypothetical protein